MENSKNKISLFRKTFVPLLRLGVTIILISLTVLYFITSEIIRVETDEGLYSSAYRIEEVLKSNKKIESLKPIFEVEVVSQLKPNTIKEVIIYDKFQNENEEFRELSKYATINEINYKISVRTLVVESDDILLSIVYAFIVIITCMYSVQYFYIKKQQNNIWKPFLENLNILKRFTIKNQQKIILRESNVLEFSDLNKSISLLTNKVLLDYNNLKQFTEDLSHEMQTPLAIIQAKIENLIDDVTINKETFFLELTNLLRNTNRLSKLNKGLVMLTKINNNQYEGLETFDVNKFIQTSINSLEDVFLSKKLTIKIINNHNLIVKGNKTLIEILISNLVNNAIKYTKPNNSISIVIDNHKIDFINPSSYKLANQEKIFNRFYKEDKNNSSLGLGLAIVKRICDYYGYKVSYKYLNKSNIFTINF